jgi:chromosome segregation ATPase
LLSAFKTTVRSSVRRLLKPVWQRVEGRVHSLVEARFQSLEGKSHRLEAQAADLQARIADFQARVADLQARNTLLEEKWQKHVPVFLGATSTVVSFERELGKLKDIVLADERANSSTEGPKTIPLDGTPQAGSAER